MKEVLTHGSLQQEEWHTLEGHTRKHQGKSGRRQSEAEARAKASLWFHGKGQARQSKQVPGPGTIKTRGCGPV